MKDTLREADASIIWTGGFTVKNIALRFHETQKHDKQRCMHLAECKKEESVDGAEKIYLSLFLMHYSEIHALYIHIYIYLSNIFLRFHRGTIATVTFVCTFGYRVCSFDILV